MRTRMSGGVAGEAGRPVPLCRLCAEHVRQLEGESPFDNLMEVKS
jgi:CTP:molybdopterin cytidylyltransferase MocA